MTLSPSMLTGSLRVSQQHSVFDQGPGRTLFIGSLLECGEFMLTLTADVRIWCKVI